MKFLFVAFVSIPSILLCGFMQKTVLGGCYRHLEFRLLTICPCYGNLTSLQSRINTGVLLSSALQIRILL